MNVILINFLFLHFLFIIIIILIKIYTYKRLDVCGSVHHSTILAVKKNPNKMQQCIKILLFLVLNEA